MKGLTEFPIKSTAYLVVWRIYQCDESSVAIFFKTKTARLLSSKHFIRGLLNTSDARTPYAPWRSVFQSCAFTHNSKS